MQTTSLLESETILRALEYANSKGAFGSPQHKKTAVGLIRRMKSNQSVSGRHQQLRDLLQRGASIDEMIRALGASRRTVFRYLNHFEEAGISIVLEDGKYKMVGK